MTATQANARTSVAIHKRFSVRLALWLLVSALLPAALIGALAFSIAHKTLEIELRNRLLAAVDTNAERIDAWAQRRRNALRGFASTAELRQSFASGPSGEVEARRAQLAQTLRLQAVTLAFRNLVAVDPQGVVVSSARETQLQGQSLRASQLRGTYIAAVFDRARMLGETEFSEFSTQSSILAHQRSASAFIAAPVFDDGRVVGVIVGEVDEAEIARNAQTVRGVGSSGTIRVVGYLDGVPRIVTDSATQTHGVFEDATPVRAESIEALALRGARGDGRRAVDQQQSVYAVWRYVPSVRWGVVTHVSEAQAFSASRQLRAMAVASCGVAALLAMVVAIWVALRVARPVAALTKASSSVMDGALDARVSVVGDDEIAQLGNVFNEMLSKIQGHTEGLEALVAQRTRELTERGARIQESIDLARKIESSMLPSESECPALVRKSVLVWRPLDQVGGDLAFIEPTPNGGFIAAMIDCTGHGIAAAMTAMFASAMCSHAIASHQSRGPAEVLRELDRKLEQVFERARGEGIALGMDVALLHAAPGQPLRFAGAGIALVYRTVDGACETIAGRRIGLGYAGRRKAVPFVEHTLDPMTIDSILLCSDGILDEPVGEHGEGLGSDRLLEMLRERASKDIDVAVREIDANVVRARGARRQRDDVTVLGLSLAHEQFGQQRGVA